MRSPSTNRAAIWSCSRVSRSASPWIAALPPRSVARPWQPGEFSVCCVALHSALRAAVCPGPCGPVRPPTAAARPAGPPSRLVDPLDCGELAHEPVEGGLVDLALAVGLLGLPGIAEQVAHHLGDRGRDRPTRSSPDTPAPAGSTSCASARERPRSLASAASISLRLDSLRNPEPLAFASGTRSVIRSLSNSHDNDAQRVSGDLLRLDGGDLAHAMGRIDHEIAGGEQKPSRPSYSSLTLPTRLALMRRVPEAADAQATVHTSSEGRGTEGKASIAPVKFVSQLCLSEPADQPCPTRRRADGPALAAGCVSGRPGWG